MSTLTISSGVTSSGLTISSGVDLVVLSGGEIKSSKILNGGKDVVSGGVALGTNLSGGGIEIVEAHGSASGTTVDSGGREIVSSGGIVSNAVVLSGGMLSVLSGGLAVEKSVPSGTETVSSGGTQVLEGPVVGSGVTLFAQKESIATVISGATLLSGALLYLTSAVIDAGGEVEVRSSGSVILATVSSGGKLIVSSQGAATGITVMSGGSEVVSSAGFQTILATVVTGGETLATGVQSATKVVSGATLMSGSVLDIISGVVDSGGDVTVHALGLLTSMTLSGGTLNALTSSVVEKTTIRSGGRLTLSGGSASGTLVYTGGTEIVSAGGLDVGTLIGSGGKEFVSAGGLVLDASVYASGALVISSGALPAEGTQIRGGTETILAGGKVSGAVVWEGFELDSGTAGGTVVRSGGQEIVEKGGIASGSVISSGGILIVSSGGALAGGLTLSGGTATISGTMGAGQKVKFVGAGVLVLDNLTGFQAKISGMSSATEKIDLGGFAFSSGGETVTWAKTGTSGTLTVTDGAKVASLTLIGTYTASDFHLSTDGHGGTYVADPPVGRGGIPAAAIRLAEAIAVFGGGGVLPAFASASPGHAAEFNVPSLIPAPSSGH